MQTIGIPATKSLDQIRSMAGSDLKDPSFCSRQSQDSVSSGNFSNLKFTAETLEKEQASMKSDLELANASNENAKLRLMQKEDEKLSRRMESNFSPTQTLADQLTENLQHLTSQVQEENSFAVAQLLPYQILSKDGKPYIMNCETKVFSPEEITDMVLTKVKEGRRVCMPPPPVPVFEDSSSDDTYDYEAPDEDIDKALYEGGDAAGIMMDCPDVAPLLEKLPAGFEYPFLTNEIASDLLDETRSRRKRVLVAAGEVRNQLDHLLCWAYSSSDLVSASLVLHGLEKEYFPLCPMYLCENVDPSQLESHVIEEEEHRCYGSNMHSALLYIKKYGIPKEASTEFNCMLARGVGADEKRYYISEVVRFSTLEAALMRLKTHPVGATLAMFTGCTDEGIYRGPMKEGSEYMGDHEVVMICCEVKKGEMVVKCKTSYGKKCCNRGYIYVSIEVLLILAGALRKQGAKLGDICHIRPQYLLSDFYSVEMVISSDENRAKNRQFLVEDDMEDQLSPDQNTAEKKKSAKRKKSASPIIWSSGKSSAQESIVGKDFLPRGSAAVRKEIQDETDRETGRSKAISGVPIHLSIYSPDADNLTLIDLPELTKVAVKGQSESIVKGIENVVRSYTEKPNRIILAISPANQDRAASDAIIISREVDPSGEITFGVLKNIDLMDKGTDAVDHTTYVSPLTLLGSVTATYQMMALFCFVNLRLIDLPELTKVAVDGQSESIVKGIENVVRSYIEKPNDIILAISPVKKDLASSDAIKISKLIHLGREHLVS
ncbi:hypothetical protein F2Q69_00048756 [Brassica cretica]|uniref:Dynamin GTPase domain-containing protein n=1 Tax=Brassica cretica TaxID=69181 RepID=A0A8S9PPD0_BRACR|nr:hypothetical protein F2Q69_00048756 [Brassica cretica]